MKRTRQQIQPAPTSCPVTLPSQSKSSSSIIPLPKSHIHRTPSELQLADETRRAEYDDVRMYARLVVGMQSQITRDYHTNGGVIHPLSKKSLAGIVKTKHADDEELHNGGGVTTSSSSGSDEGEVDWEMTHDIDHEEHQEVVEDNISVHSPWSTITQRPLASSKSGSDGSLSTHGSMIVKDSSGEGLIEDDFVFSLEL